MVKRAAARKIGGTCAAPTFTGHHVRPHTRHITAKSAAFRFMHANGRAPSGASLSITGPVYGTPNRDGRCFTFNVFITPSLR